MPATSHPAADGVAPHVRASPPVDVPVRDLVLSDAPRWRVDPVHVDELTRDERPWPPVLVHSPSNRVIDGLHRVHAARARGAVTIEALLVECAESEIMAIAIAINRAAGRDLTLEDRKRAACRLLTRHPEWSSRRIARATCLAPGTVEKLRPTLAPDEVRIGSNGRTHSRRPRQRNAPPARPATTTGRTAAAPLTDLRSEPALRSSPVGQRLLLLLSAAELQRRDWYLLVRAVPPQCIDAVAATARECALAWHHFAATTERQRAAGPR